MNVSFEKLESELEQDISVLDQDDSRADIIPIDDRYPCSCKEETVVEINH